MLNIAGVIVYALLAAILAIGFLAGWLAARGKKRLATIVILVPVLLFAGATAYVAFWSPTFELKNEVR